jgi:hypothetical protein
VANQDHGFRLLANNANQMPLSHTIQHNEINQNQVGIELHKAVST